MMRNLRHILTDNRLLVRLMPIWIIGILLNLAGWAVGFYFLPEQALRGILPGGNFISVDGEVIDTLVSIIVYNIAIGGGLIAAANLFRIGWFPLGYLPVVFHWTMFGVFLGTNSFDIDQGAKIAPSLLHLVQSPGFLEISGFTLIAVGTINLYLYKQDSLFRMKASKVREWKQVRLKVSEVFLLFTAVGLIFLGAYMESLSILFG